MKISIDRRVKMVPVMEINAGDEVNVGGFEDQDLIEEVKQNTKRLIQ